MRAAGFILGLFGASWAQDSSWGFTTPMFFPRQEVAAAVVEGEMYVVGGLQAFPQFSDSSVVEVYSSRSHDWSQIPDVPKSLHHTAAVGVNGKLFVIGGHRNLFSTHLDSVYEFDPDRMDWTEKSPLPGGGRGSLTACEMGGKIYAAGGLPDQRSRNFAVYDVQVDRWEELPSMPTGRNHLGSACSNGRVYAIGGRDNDMYDVVEVFDVDTNEWLTMRPMPRPRGGVTAVLIDEDHIIALGGEGNEEHPLGMFPDNDVYHIPSDTWFSVEDMPLGLHGIAAVLLDGRVHIAGGATQEGLGVSNSHIMYNPDSDLAALEFCDGILSSDGIACCLSSCGICRQGRGCRDLTGGSAGCCPSRILLSDDVCGGVVKAPCYME